MQDTQVVIESNNELAKTAYNEGGYAKDVKRSKRTKGDDNKETESHG